MSSVRSTPAMLFVLLSVVCSGVDSGIPDYSAGLEKLIEIGLPDLSEAKPVLLISGNGLRVPLLRPPGWYRDYLSDVAWLVKEEDDKLYFFLVGGLCEIALPRPTEKPEGPDAVATRGTASAAWDDIELPEYIRSQKRSILKAARQAEMHGSPAGNEWVGTLLWAAMLHSHGETAAANEIAHLVFENTANRRELLQGSISAIFDGRYNQLAIKFSNEGNLELFADGVDRLAQAGDRSWQSTAEAGELVEFLRPFAAKMPPPLPDDGFTDDQKRIAAACLRTDSRARRISPNSNFDGVWLLAPPRVIRYGGRGSTLTELMALGTDALPILDAWLEDETPTYILQAPARWDRYSEEAILWELDAPPGMGMGMGRGGQDVARRERLPRPLLRSGLAAPLLRCLAPAVMHGEFDGSDGVSDDDLRLLVRKLHEKPLLDVAGYYLREGTNSQMQVAAGYLLAKGREEHIAAVERAIVLVEQDWHLVRMLGMYAAERGTNGAAFIERMATGIEDEDYAPALAELQRQVGLTPEPEEDEDRDLSQLLAAFLKDQERPAVEDFDTDLFELPPSVERVLRRTLRGDDAVPAIEKTVEAAAACHNPAAAMALLEVLLMVRFGDYDGGTFSPGAQGFLTWEAFMTRQLESPPPGPPTRPGDRREKEWDVATMLASVRKHKEAWRELLSRDEGTIEFDYASDPTETVQVYAAMAILALIVGDVEALESDVAEDVWLLPDEGTGWLVKASRDIIEGQSDRLPPFPDPEKVNPERRDELTEALQAKTGAELAGLLAGLRADEMLFVIQFLDGQANDDVIEKMADISRVIVNTVADTEDDKAKAILATMKGKSVSEKTGRACYQLVKDLASRGQSTRISVACSLFGATVKLSPVPEGMLVAMYAEDEVPVVTIMLATVSTSEDDVSCVAPLDSKASGKAAKPAKEDDLDADLDADLDDDLDDDLFAYGDDEEDLWEVLKTIEVIGVDDSDYFNLQFMGLVPPAKPQ